MRIHLFWNNTFYNGIVQFQKISILPPWKVFYFAPLTPLGNSSLASYFACEILTFKTPLPLGSSNDLPWGGYGVLLKLHIVNIQFVLVLKQLLLWQRSDGWQITWKTVWCRITSMSVTGNNSSSHCSCLIFYKHNYISCFLYLMQKRAVCVVV